MYSVPPASGDAEVITRAGMDDEAGGSVAGGGAARVLALDVGGTKLAAAVVDATGAVMGHVERPTPPGADAETVFEALQAAIAASLQQASVSVAALRGIGVGSGGPMRYPEGIVSPLNIPGWRDFPL